jgi:hypothetical protein
MPQPGSLAGTLSPDGAHLHIAVADSRGAVIGGHLCAGSLVRTTAELVVGLLPEWQFGRELDPATGYTELQISPRAPGPQAAAAAPPAETPASCQATPKTKPPSTPPATAGTSAGVDPGLDRDVSGVAPLGALSKAAPVGARSQSAPGGDLNQNQQRPQPSRAPKRYRF